MSGWHDPEFRERLRAVKDHIERKARRRRDTRFANNVTADEKVIAFPRAPRLPMHR